MQSPSKHPCLTLYNHPDISAVPGSIAGNYFLEAIFSIVVTWL